MDRSIFKPMLCFLLIIVLIVSFIFIIDGKDRYFQNKFIIKINNQELKARLDVKYKKLFINNYNYYDCNKNSCSFEDSFARINREDKIILNVNEYEVYNRFNKRVSYNNINGNYDYKEVIDENKTMMVQRMGKTVYEGEFISDISDIVKEDGRYYFHIYTKSKRNFTPFSKVETSIHFSVYIGDKV